MMIRQYHINAVQSRITYNKHGVMIGWIEFVLLKRESGEVSRMMNANETLKRKSRRMKPCKLRAEGERLWKGYARSCGRGLSISSLSLSGRYIKLVFTNKLPYTVSLILMMQETG